MCSLGIEPTTFALLTQCSTTEPQEHIVYILHNSQLWAILWDINWQLKENVIIVSGQNWTHSCKIISQFREKSELFIFIYLVI